MVRVWLASQSRRRAQMLEPLFVDLECRGLPDVDERSPQGDVESQVHAICKRKVDAVPSQHHHDLVIVSDTMLADPDDLNCSLGKPSDSVQAAMMLHRLSGRRHQVWSATALQLHGQWRFFVEYAVVEIDELTDEQLVELVLSESWKGKAGGYDLAGPMGAYARLIDGDEATVLGIAGTAMEVLCSVAES